MFWMNPARLRAMLKDLNIPSQALQLVGTAGTVTTLAAMLLEMDLYQPSRVNGLILSEEWLTRLIDRLATLSLAQRRELAGLEKGREGIILGGALIVHELMNGLEQLTSPWLTAASWKGLCWRSSKRNTAGRRSCHHP